jgi:MFS family permease
MSRALRWYDAITINIFFMGLSTLAQTMTPLVIPLLVQQFVGEEQQGTYYGTIRLWTLMVALLVQALMGTLSDHSQLSWGRRRPFIFIGTLAGLVIITAIGLSAGLNGMNAYWFLFAMLILLMVASNTAQAGAQGLIPDLVPKNKQGRYSGVKALFEVPIPLILVAFTIGRLIASGNYWAGITISMVVLALTMIITMFAPEKRLTIVGKSLDFQPFVRLLLMTAVFTSIILILGEIVELVGNQIQQFDRTSLLIIMGALGLLAMTIAIGIGVWLSIRISLGKAAKNNSSYSWWVINRLAFFVGSTNLASFAVFFLQGRLGLEKEQAAGPASQLIMLVGIFILLFALPSGWLSDKFGSKTLVIVSGIFAALGTLILIISPSLPLMYVGGVIVGVATGLFFTSNWALGTALVPEGEAGRYLGISNLAGAGAGAVGAYIGGPIADFFTIRFPELPGLGYVLLFSIYGLLFVLSILAVSRVKPSNASAPSVA